jgi:hypothetical protein
MSRLSSPSTAELWAERIAQCERSNLPVAQFCQSIGCSVTSFYQSRRWTPSARSSNRLPKSDAFNQPTGSNLSALGAHRYAQKLR